MNIYTKNQIPFAFDIADPAEHHVGERVGLSLQIGETVQRTRHVVESIEPLDDRWLVHVSGPIRNTLGTHLLYLRGD